MQGHLGRVGEERCAHIRALVIVNQALMSRQHLEEQAENRLREAGTTPPGNGIDRSEWEVRIQGFTYPDLRQLNSPLPWTLAAPYTSRQCIGATQHSMSDFLICSKHASRF